MSLERSFLAVCCTSKFSIVITLFPFCSSRTIFFFFLRIRRPRSSPLFPSPPLSRSPLGWSRRGRARRLLAAARFFRGEGCFRRHRTAGTRREKIAPRKRRQTQPTRYLLNDASVG